MTRRGGLRGVLVAMALAVCAPALAADAGAQTRPLAGPSAEATGLDSRILVFLRIPPSHYRPDAAYGDAYAADSGRAARLRIARRLAREHGLSLVDGWPMPLLGLDCFVFSAPGARSAAELAQALARDPNVSAAEPNQVFEAKGAAAGHVDPLYKAQPAARLWRLSELHGVSTGRGVRVAVVDSRIDRNHPDLEGQVSVERDFTADPSQAPELHGTGVAGVIAARANNGVGIAGVAPEARLLALRACWQLPAAQGGEPRTICDSLSLAKAVHFAVEHGAQVINMSLSGPPDPLLASLIDLAIAHGATVVGAYDRAAPGGGFPANHRGVIAVVDDAGSAPRQGAIGGAIGGALAAPGRDVPTTSPGGGFQLVDGASFAAAHVSGLFALLRARDPRARGVSALVLGAGGEIDAPASLRLAACDCDRTTALARAAAAGR